MLSARRMVFAVAAVAALLALPSSASALHNTCSAQIFTPWPIYENGNRVSAMGAAEAWCANGATGKLYVSLWRDRAWGWQKLSTSSHSLDNHGDSGFVNVSYWCNGEGTFTYRTTFALSVLHPLAGPFGTNYVITERTSGTRRWDC